MPLVFWLEYSEVTVVSILSERRQEMKHHNYRHKSGGYWRGHNPKSGKFFTVQESTSSSLWGVLALGVLAAAFALLAPPRD